MKIHGGIYGGFHKLGTCAMDYNVVELAAKIELCVLSQLSKVYHRNDRKG